MPFVTVDGQALHYIDQGTGPAVLLAGSYLWDQAMWAPQIAVLSQHYRVIALDLWGHGESGRMPEGMTSLDDVARQALALLDHLDIDRVTLVGLSVGGMWGVRLALSAPQRLNGLVLMDTYVGVEPEPTRQYYFSLFKQIEDSGEISSQLLDIIVPIFFRPGIDPQSALYQDFRARLAALPVNRLRESIVPMGRITFSRDDLLPRLAQLNPETTLLMCGDQDKPRPPSETQEMAELIGCPYVLVPEAGHISSLENPQFVTDALLKFLADRNPCSA
ncbi:MULTISPECIES: alpha/beta fold hydrolase [Pseudomonas]|jgi:pimeloyl-ACP methyl ester carboxylesterase|uniref:Pimeloyl-ACP methyl ester carboxylesterase n=1 Tax=Pseudomonas umsongensis TaxID=198618 RepID=A0ACC5MFD6_9PSED|nr:MULTISPECIES: alpha/beta fold hydrolase [Pseudomonas]MBB2887275.1 pimeloyl-ACP methyl ester carboxylesterase [Pseudomonas umsongensis]NMN76388.1 pimeloyl-ACP methyl ester carboxylesterase [Pseudomonas sp. KD5]GID05889.1 2-succinyl-6-hydroxy-2,4-cyclohexadiene-1-carboxy late synthase [Pseudomonas sp. 008]CAH0258884.1 3-oxoadipate enol-lactonase 2 [Pseudomonas sp. Bi123]